MKKLFTAIAIMAAISTTSYAQTKVSDIAKFNTESIDLGKLKQGVPTTATFIVKNISKKPLLIEKTMPSCGCTAAEYTKTPILPGKTGTVTATYNAAALGKFNKSVSVKFAELPDITTLGISGEVEAKQ
jgi:hypothetical protein